MGKYRPLILAIFVAIIIGSFSCRKEFSCEDCLQTNKPPVAVAGPDQILNAGRDSVILDGSASEDQEGEIKGFEWKYLSGQGSVEISDKDKAVTSVKKFSTGLYQFELKVTDDKGITDLDTVEVIIGTPSPNFPPVANAGIDQVIFLPASSAELNGSKSTDPDNNITKYE
jgi:hypothetical protein